MNKDSTRVVADRDCSSRIRQHITQYIISINSLVSIISIDF